MANRPNGVFKMTNDYMDALSGELYDKTPKAVFAALAVSLFANDRGIVFSDLDNAILEEWKVLYEQGIVPQKPIKLTHPIQK
jgi:hypothetical protein